MANKSNLLHPKFILIGILLVVLGFVTIFYNPTKLDTPTSFVETPRSVETQEEKFTFLAFGDSGTGSREQRILAKLMLVQSPQVIIHTGDVAYQSGTFEEIRKNVLEIYKDLFAEASFYPSLGNHDYLTEKAKPLIETFDFPGNERYYHFKFGNTLFIALDTNKSLDENPNEMISWLDETLAKEKATWIIVYFHHPPFSSGANHGSDARVQQKVVPILEKHGVDIVFAGHDHNYQRTCLIFQNKCQKNGVLYIVTGGGGARLYPVGKPEWFTKTQTSAYHFVKGTVEGCNLKLEAIDIDNQVFDSISLLKCDVVK